MDGPLAELTRTPRRPPDIHTKHPRPFSWRRVVGSGIVLFLATTAILFITGNPNLYPTVTLIGNFLVPVAFVAFLYDHQHLTTIDFESLAAAFVIGGILGVLGASLLEPYLVPRFLGANGGLGLSGGLVVGLIEEGSKLVAVVVVARGLQHIGALDGLLLGAAIGMGFAALESTGYSFTVLLESGGDVQASLVETVVRGFLAPFGHGTWTAIVGAALFADSRAGHFRVTPRLLVAFAFVVILHGSWDGLPLRVAALPFGVPLPISVLAVGVIGLAVLTVVYRESAQSQAALEAAGLLPPPAGT